MSEPEATTTAANADDPTFVTPNYSGHVPTAEEVAWLEAKHTVINPLYQAAKEGKPLHLNERQTMLAERFLNLQPVETKLVWEDETPEGLKDAAYLLKLDFGFSQGLGLNAQSSLSNVRLVSYNKTPPLHQLVLCISIKYLTEQLPFLFDLLKTENPDHEPHSFEIKIPLTDEKYRSIMEMSTVGQIREETA